MADDYHFEKLKIAYSSNCLTDRHEIWQSVVLTCGRLSAVKI